VVVVRQRDKVTLATNRQTNSTMDVTTQALVCRSEDACLAGRFYLFAFAADK